VDDSTDSDLGPSDQRSDKLVLLSKKINIIFYRHITQGNFVLSLLLCVFLFL